MAAASGIDPSNTGALQTLQEGRVGANAALAAKGTPPVPGPSADAILAASKARVAAMGHGAQEGAGIPAGMGPGPGTQPFEEAPPPSDEAIQAATQQAGDQQFEGGLQSSVPAPDMGAVTASLPKGLKAPEPGPGLGFTGTEDQAVNHLMGGFASLGRMLSDATNAPLTRLLWPGLNDIDPNGSVHDHVNALLDSASDYWKTDDSKAGFGARLVGDAASMVPALLTGPAALPTMVGQSASETNNAYLQAGVDARTAATLALVSATATGIGGALPLHAFPNLLPRLAIGIGGNVALTPASEALTKSILNDNGYKKAADNIDPMDPDSIARSGIMGAIFAFMGGPKAKEILGNPKPPPAPEEAPPPSDAAKAAAPQPAPPPSPVAVQQGAYPSDLVSGTGGIGRALAAQGSNKGTVPDQPTAEPAKDLRAQFKDMYDKDTPRTGVFLSDANKAQLTGGKNADSIAVQNSVSVLGKSSRSIDLPNGTLYFRTKADATGAKARLDAGEDPQSVIGSVTGAGSGKTPDQTAVVQGHTPEGAVAAEKMVAPAEVPAAAKAMVAEGKNPVVTTPDEAIQRRADEIAKEIQPQETAPAAVSPEPTTGAEPTAPAAVPKMGMFKPEKGMEQAVHIEEGAPEGMLRVRPIGDNGEPSDHTIDVPADRVSTGKHKPAETPTAQTASGETEQPATPKTVAPEQAPTDVSPAEHTTGGAPPVDRRLNVEQRQRVSQMSPEEMRSTLLTNELTKIPNRRAYEESEKLPVQVHVDLDNFKHLNDTKGHEAGDNALRTVAKVLHEETGGNAYHISGDEFKVQGDNKAKVATQLARARSRLATEGIEFSRGIGKDTAEAEKSLQADKAARSAAGIRGARGEGAAKPKAAVAKATTALGSLAEALSTHEQQETVPDGEKYPASLAERQDNASSFANVLKAAAKDAVGSAPVPAIERANRAANAAIGLTSKSAEDTAKGRGTSHARVTALVAEMHKAARGILGTSKEGDEIVVAPKAAELKAKIAAKKTAPEAAIKTEKPKPKEPLVEVPVNEKYADQLKPKALGEKDQTRMLALKARYVGAETAEEAAKHRAAIDQILHDMNRPPRERDQIMHYLDEERAANQKPATRMSDTIEEEESQYDEKNSDLTKVYRPAIADIKQTAFNNRMGYEWKSMADNLNDEGYMHYLQMHKDSGTPISSHAMLNQMITHADTPILKDILMHLRGHSPDTPVYAVSAVHNLRTGEIFRDTAGLFHGPTQSIQINLDSKSSRADTQHVGMMQALVHEMYHSASLVELDQHPESPASHRLDQLLDVLRSRLRSKYGNETIDKHLAYFNDYKGGAVRPDGFMRELYGITNTHELVSEVGTNPNFIREIADSELFESPKENLGPVKETLLSRIYRAIGQMFGVKDPRLLQHIMSAVSDTMDNQMERYANLSRRSSLDVHQNMPDVARQALTAGATPLELARAAPGLRSLRTEPDHLSHVIENAFSRTFGDDEEPAATARAFNHVTKGKAIDALRKTKIAFKTQGQIYRDHMADFGGDKQGNPLRELQEADINKNILIHKMAAISKPVSIAWGRLHAEDEAKMSQLMIDTTMYRIDPRQTEDAQPGVAKARAGFSARYAEYAARFSALSPEAQRVYSDAADANKSQLHQMRAAGVDTAIKALDLNLSDAQKKLLYGAKTPEVYDSIIGDGKLIDVGENNDKLKASLRDFAGMTEIEGPYFHLGRQGDYVVAARPEGTRSFNDPAKANEWAARARELSPDSTATVAERGGKHVVDYKIKYVSMHETRADAESEQARLVAAGFEPGLVTQKTMGSDSAPLSYGLKELVSEAERKIQRDGTDEGTQAMVASLRSAFLQMTAARSAYSGSRLARKNVGGVKAEDMQRNFAQHSTSTMWHAAQMRTVFEQAAALARVRAMARDSQSDVSQRTMYRRGQVVAAINKHANDEVQNYGHKAPLNSMLAKLGFASFLASPSHAMIWMTQNYTTGIPWAGARYGYGRSAGSFLAAMKAVTSPALREMMAQKFRGLNADPSAINETVLKYVATHPRFGKWAQGPNSPLQQLVDRGVLDHGYANELGAIARGDNPMVNHAFNWARILPTMADSFNRISTALAGLELTGGDVRKTSDMVQIIHADYSAQNKPLAFKKINRVPGMTSLTMFKTYAQEMTHLVYSNLINTMRNSPDGRVTAAKTLAGVVLGNALFAGVYGGAALAPLQLAMYAYHKIADQEGEVWDFKNAVHMFLVDHLGKTAGNAAAYGLPNLLGADVSSRMGLADLFFHNPPDLLSSDKEMWKNFVFQEAGTMPQLLAQNITSFVAHMQKGEPFQAISSVIPVKQYQDATKAYQLFTTGKQDSLGGQMTQPSGRDAFMQLAGIKPASVAEAQEKAQVRVEVGQGIKAAKQSIIKALATAQDADAVNRAQARMDSFNDRYPESAIKAGDLQGIERMRQEDEDEQSRHQSVEENTNF